MNIELSFSEKNAFPNLYRRLNSLKDIQYKNILKKYGEMGVAALKDATPVKTGKTASSWFYEIVKDDSGYQIKWNNSNINDGVNIAVILQLGHGLKNGGYVEGIDYINPALKDVFDGFLYELVKEVSI